MANDGFVSLANLTKLGHQDLAVRLQAVAGFRNHGCIFNLVI